MDGQPRTGLTATDITTGNLTDWAPGFTGADFGGQVIRDVQVLVVEDDVVYVGGRFDSIKRRAARGLTAS